jgi:hypothetical protein
VTYGCGGSADLAKGYHIFAAKAAYCRRDAASAHVGSGEAGGGASSELTH